MEHQLLLCECSDPQHQLIFSKFEEDDQVYMSTHLTKLPFLQRLRIGINYIFGKQCNYGAFQEIILDKEKLTLLLNKMNSNNLSEILKQIYNEFVNGASIDVLSKQYGVTCTEMFNLVQMGKRLCA